MRWLKALTPGCVLAVGLILGIPAVSAGVHSPAVVGDWSAPIDVGVIGIHATLLPTGQVLLFEYPFDDAGSEAHLIDPVSGENIDVSFDFRRNLFCSGHSLMPDGRVLVTGGQKYEPTGFNGIKAATIFDPFTGEWSDAQPMYKARWYPTNVQMPDGTTLVLTGLGADGVTLQKRMERFDPATGQWTLLPTSANNSSELYARMFVLPDGNVFRAGPNQDGQLFHPDTNTWSFVANMDYGYRSFPGAVLMPDLTTVLISGGSVTATTETIDLTDPSPSWSYTDSMTHARYNHNLVMLPDGTYLAVGGGADESDLYGDPVKMAELYDPASGTWQEMVAQTAERTYHSTALLLPDGRVMSAGSDGGNMPRTIEYYSPPYLFQGDRPTITSAPGSVTYGEAFRIRTPEAADISRVTLMKLGSVTHSNNFEQRQVDLNFTIGAGKVSATVPTNAAMAPPGYYMLFLLNGSGIPSVASMVLLG